MYFTEKHQELTSDKYISKTDLGSVFDDLKECVGTNAMIEHIYYWLPAQELREWLASFCHELSDGETQDE